MINNTNEIRRLKLLKVQGEKNFSSYKGEAFTILRITSGFLTYLRNKNDKKA